MDKGFLKFILKLIILLLVIWLIFAIMVRGFGMYIFDEEYASYKQTLDYINTKSDEKDSVLILGDSVAKAGIIPEKLDDNAYNISMAGATAIEEYYSLKTYLENHETPNAVIIMFFMGGAYNDLDGYFWSRTIYFDVLSMSQYKEIVDTNLLPYTKGYAWSEFLQYKLCSPFKYYAAVKNALLENRYEINMEEYETSEKNKGQHYFGTASSYAPNNVSITDKETFEVQDTIDYYFNELIKLCEENDIKVIIEQHPINLSTYVNMKEDFTEGYLSYMESLQEKYPNIIVNTELGVITDDTWFGDFSHLNENGATQFTQILKERYSQYF